MSHICQDPSYPSHMMLVVSTGKGSNSGIGCYSEDNDLIL
jgi:hypothetical protein